MGYTEEEKRIFDYVTENGMIIELTANMDNVKRYYRELKTYADSKRLAIRYPGYKTTKTKCDYCVCIVDERGENPISHVEIMYDLYNKTSIQNYSYMKSYVEEVAKVGKDIKIPYGLTSAFEYGFSFEELTDLMFYIAIQEDINYPNVYYQGRKMCFYRYLEAIYCKVHENHKIEEAVNRAVARGHIPKNWDDVGDLYEVVSKIPRY